MIRRKFYTVYLYVNVNNYHRAYFLLQFFASSEFAISGVLSALRKQMDIIGVCVCGFLAAFGGGTLRDVLLDRHPLFWVEHALL